METFDFDLYEELGVQPSADAAEIRAAYKKKALVHHPDRNGGVQSEEFLRLKQAYDMLVDPAKRQNYDAFHHTGEFKRDGRPLSAKEAAWLVDQQKRSWGVREIHPFAVCILCDSCPCPADGVCSGCGMTYCQMCVRKMHCRGGMQPHYPLKSSTKFSEDLAEKGKEKEREHKLLKGNSNQWLMHDEDFRRERDVFNARAKREAPELCWYWAWGQTRYTVHLAMWLAAEDHDADIAFRVDDEGKQVISVTPHGQQRLLDATFAYPVDTSRAGEAFTFGHMHCMSFVMLKQHPGQRWRKLFEGDSEGFRELPLGEPPHSVATVQVDGFKPVNHYRVAGRKESASEWHEVTVNVPIPENAERKHVHVELSESRLSVHVAGWMAWDRRVQSRNLKWEDKHESRTHVDLHNSTWLMTRDETRDFKCVQFVLSEWQEGANKNAESDIRKQLEDDKGQFLLEDADPFHMYDLVEAEMFLRAGAVFKPRSKLRKKALELVEQMEKHMEAEGESAHDAPFADAWEADNDEDYTGRNRNQIVVRDEDGGEVEEAAEWWAASEREEKEEWNMEIDEQNEEAEARRLYAKQAAKEQEERAALAAAAKHEEEERERNIRRKEQALKNREAALRLAAKLEADAPEVFLEKREAALVQQMGIEQAREANAAAARATPLPPKKLDAAAAPAFGAAAAAMAALDVSDAAGAGGAGGAGGAAASGPAALRVASLAKCGYYFEDAGDELVKVTVPLGEACGEAPLPKEGAVKCVFTELSFKLEVTLNGAVHKLDVDQLLHRINPAASQAKVRVKAKKVIVELAKLESGKAWKKLRSF